MNSENPDFGLQKKPKEDRFLTGEEIMALLTRLEEKQNREWRDIGEDPEQMARKFESEFGSLKAGDILTQDELEAVSEFFKIDIDGLRRMPSRHADLLNTEFRDTAPQSAKPPLGFETQQQSDDWKKDVEKAGGVANYFAQMVPEKKRKYQRIFEALSSKDTPSQGNRPPKKRGR